MNDIKATMLWSKPENSEKNQPVAAYAVYGGAIIIREYNDKEHGHSFFVPNLHPMRMCHAGDYFNTLDEAIEFLKGE